MRGGAVAVAIGVVLAGTATVALASRNSSGTYSVSASGTYPFVTGTTISSTTMNSVFSDMSTELTDSLSRSGKGGMLAPLRCTDGSVSAPSLSFTNETGSGFYRIGPRDVGLSLGGTKRWEHTESGMIETGWVQIAGTLTVAGKIDRPSLPTVGQQVSSTCGFYILAGTTYADVPNLSVTITTTGRPVVVALQPDGSANVASLALGGSAAANIQLLRDSSTIGVWGSGQITPLVVDTGAGAGSHTYKVQGKYTGSAGANIDYYVLVAYEL